MPSKSAKNAAKRAANRKGEKEEEEEEEQAKKGREEQAKKTMEENAETILNMPLAQDDETEAEDSHLQMLLNTPNTIATQETKNTPMEEVGEKMEPISLEKELDAEGE